MSIKPVFTTMGQSSRASLGNDKRYVYGGSKPLKQEADPPPHNTKAVSAKQQRMARYAECLAEGMTREQSAERVGIGLDTAKTYDRELKERQRRERRDG